MSNTLESALALAANGWHVHPVKADKTPHLKSWPEVATTDPDTISAWWDTYPEALPAIVPGKSNVTVVDIDRHEGKASGVETARELDLPAAAIVTRTSLSGNGQHLYYRGASSSVNGIYAGIDRKSSGGYIVVAYDLPAPEAISEALPALYASSSRGVDARPFSRSVQEWADEYAGQPQGDKVAAKLAWLAGGEALTGHEAMLKLQKTAVLWAGEGEGGVPELLVALRERWMDSTHGEGDEPGLEWDRALSTAIATYGGVKVAAGQGDIASNPIKVLTRADLRKRPAPKWWIGGLWQQDTIGILAGSGGIGKSFLMLDQAARIASGTDWHGHATTRGNVLYVAAEGLGSFTARMDAWEEHNGLPFPEESVSFVESGFNLGDPESVEYFKQHVVALEADFIILDTLSQLTSIESENDAAQLAGVMRVARGIREVRRGTTVILVHHASKASGVYRGSTAIRDNVDTLVAAKSDGTSFLLSTALDHDGKQKDGEPVTLRGFELTSVPGTESAVIARVSTATAEHEAISRTLLEGPAGTKDFMVTFRDLNPEDTRSDDALRKAINRELSSMVSHEQIEKTGNGAGTKYSLEHVQPA